MNLDTLQAEVAAALEPAFRARLLAQGQARSMILRDGVLPSGAPRFATTLPYDLIAYGEALLLHGIRIRAEGGDEYLARRALVQAGEAIEAVVANGVPDDPQRGFLRLLSAAAFHLGRSSARAYSMLVTSLDDANLSRLERALALVILRSLDRLEEEIAEWQVRGTASEERLVDDLVASDVRVDDGDADGQFEESIFDALDTALCDRLYAGLGIFLLALQVGEEMLVDRARDELQTGLAVSADINLVPQWWCFRLAVHLIDDLWQSSYHQLLPQTPPDGENATWKEERNLFIASLYCRRRAEIELWPSQIEGARRAVDHSDNLVVSMPTSAGKTRVAELCILRCLSGRKRVVFVTPLRALSAQTEIVLRNTFGLLGKSVSALYGSMGMGSFEEDTLRSRDIVVATPEKLDFALRNDPSILDDVGLVVLDEGHMVGLGEREIRYEVQIQRLLNRADAHERRIVCLSAILPDGDDFDDFIRWIRNDNEGTAVKGDWRPTRLRFGEVLWGNQGAARLELRVGEERPFVPTFFEAQVPLRGRRRKLFPRSQRELVIATAWRLLEDDHSVIVYCPERRSVGPYAREIVDLASKGLINSALSEDEGVLADALAIGEEWLGDSHPILGCLRLGVAVHHGALPTPFRKELERLLRAGVLKVTVSSPTLAQGLNLSATSIVMHGVTHYRDGKQRVIATSDFKNIVGRAGRAFVDVEGLVLFPIFDRRAYRRQQWNELLKGTDDHEMESGLLRLVMLFLNRLHQSLGKPGINELADYVLNNSTAWEVPVVPHEDDNQKERSALQWRRNLAVLDTALLSLVGDEEIANDELAVRIDELLLSSFWHRQITRHYEKYHSLFRAVLTGRARLIWQQTNAAQRRGYFLAGVGLASGQTLDALAAELDPLLVQANGAILKNDGDRAVAAILALAERLFEVEPFVPEPFPDEWREVMELWLRGRPLTDSTINRTDDVLRFVENGLVYKLPWAVDAVRVRAIANGDIVDADSGDLTVDGFETGLIVPCLETGTLNPCAARLMQSGFTSRLGAIRAVTDTNADFADPHQLKEWLRSPDVVILSEDQSWPTPESHRLWLAFIDRHAPDSSSTWSLQRGDFLANWRGPDPPAVGEVVRLRFTDDGEGAVLSPSFRELGMLGTRLKRRPAGLFDARVDGTASISYVYRGPTDISVAE